MSDFFFLIYIDYLILLHLINIQACHNILILHDTDMIQHTYHSYFFPKETLCHGGSALGNFLCMCWVTEL